MNTSIWSACNWHDQIGPDLCGIYTIILLKSVCPLMLANCRSQFLLDRLGRYLTLFGSTDSTSCHEFAFYFSLAFCLYAKNIQKLSRRPTLVYVAVEWTSDIGNNAVTVEWPATHRSRNNCGHTYPRQIEPKLQKSTSRNDDN